MELEQHEKLGNWFHGALIGFPRRLALLLPLLPPLLLFRQIMICSVNVPFGDQWNGLAMLIPKWLAGSLSFADLFAQHNEHRIFFPRVVSLGLAKLSSYDVRYEMVLSFLCACVFFLCLWYYLRLTSRSNQASLTIPLCFISMLTFGPIQYENWLWGFQLSLFLPATCLAAVLALSVSRYTIAIKYIIGILLTIVGMYSSGNGILLWVLVLPVLMITDWERFSRHIWLVFPWILVAALNIGLYFIGYVRPGHHPKLSIAFTQPWNALLYFMAFLGMPLAAGFEAKLKAALACGAILVICFGCIAAYIFLVSRDRQLIGKTIGWLSLAAYALLSDALATICRVGFGPDQALASRYTTFAINLIISLIVLVPATLKHFAQSRPKWINEIQVAHVASLLAGFLLCAHIAASMTGVYAMRAVHAARLELKAKLQLWQVMPEATDLRGIFASEEMARDISLQLDGLGMIRPKMVTASTIEDVLDRSSKGIFGSIEALASDKANDGAILASGWAILPRRRECADVVVFTCNPSGSSETMFDLAERGIPRPDVVQALSSDRYFLSGWRKRIPRNRIPLGCTEISAWSYDSEARRAYRLLNPQALPQ